jgi:uncharacterized membrane protein
MRFSNDLVSLGVSVLLLGAYHYYLKRQLRRNPTYTIQAVNNIVRTAWVEGIMANSSKDILAIQTLRNSTMAATFLASTAVLLILGTLTLSGQGAQFSNTWHGLNVAGTTAPELWVIKLLLLVIDFFVAFFSFSISIRIFNHVGYMINIPPTLKDYLTPQRVAAHLNRAGRFYTTGMRAYYFSVPLVFWLFGPHLMVLATVGLIVVLYRLDRA